MKVVRMARHADLDALWELAAEAGPGLTTLKPDRDALRARIDRIERTLEGSAGAGEKGYLFVLEDTVSGEVVGVAGLEAQVGLIQPFYNYRVSTTVHASRELDVRTSMRMLHITNDLTGYAELCSLFLTPRARQDGNGALLSKARFMFAAQFPERFPQKVCAELRGHFDADGSSPFWNAVGSHFYRIDFHQADYLSSHGKKSFVAELMPRFPMYVELLPAAAQAAIGQTHEATIPARRLLEAEGLRYENLIDIFDGGPVLEAYFDTTRAVRQSALATVSVVPGAAGDESATADDHAMAGDHATADGRAPVDNPVPAGGGGTATMPGRRWLVATARLADFRVVLAARGPVGGAMCLGAAEARALAVRPGDTVRVLPARAE